MKTKYGLTRAEWDLLHEALFTQELIILDELDTAEADVDEKAADLDEADRADKPQARADLREAKAELRAKKQNRDRIGKLREWALTHRAVLPPVKHSEPAPIRPGPGRREYEITIVRGHQYQEGNGDEEPIGL